MGTPPLPEKVQQGEAGGQRVAMPPGVGKGGSGRPSLLTERGAGTLLTAREADGAFARGGWDPSCSVIKPSPLFHARGYASPGAIFAGSRQSQEAMPESSEKRSCQIGHWDVNLRQTAPATLRQLLCA